MIHEQASAVLSAIRTIENERRGLEALETAIRIAGKSELGAAFSRAVETIAAASGRVIVTGMGKSGHIGRKIAATLASTGQPASFVHPAEASHGDLGMVQNGDVVLGVSWSGETVELAAIITFAKRYAIPLIAMTANADSALGREADVCLDDAERRRGLPQRARADDLDDHATRARRRACDRVARGPRLHRARLSAPSIRAASSARKLQHVRGRHAHRRADSAHRGATRAWRRRSSRCRPRGSAAWRRSTAIGWSGSSPTAIFAAISKRNFSLDTPVAEVMTRKPRTIAPDALVAEALESISHKISALLVVERGAVVGIVHFHDLMRIGAV